MKLKITDAQNYSNIADAIRAKGGEGDFKPTEMAEAVLNLSEESHSVRYIPQTLTDSDKAQARINIDAAEKGANGLISLRRLDSYLYEATFGSLISDDNIDSLPGMCSSFVMDGKLYTNLDWNYSNTASFHIICPGFEGTAFLEGLTNTELNNKLIGQLPYHIRDGRNDYGIMVATHVLYNDWDAHGTGSIPLTKLPFIILNQVKSMETIEEDLGDILGNLYSTPAMEDAEYLIQVLVTDGVTTCLLTPAENASLTYEILNITVNPKLTNLKWIEDEFIDGDNIEKLQTRPTGIERWNYIPAPLDELRFTLAYEEPDRLSEFIGINKTTKESPYEDLMEIYAIANAAYAERTRDGSTWQTMHSVIYSPMKMEHLWIQENWERDYISSTGGEPEEGEIVYVHCYYDDNEGKVVYDTSVRDICDLVQNQGKVVHLIEEGIFEYLLSTCGTEYYDDILHFYCGFISLYKYDISDSIRCFYCFGHGQLDSSEEYFEDWEITDEWLGSPDFDALAELVFDIVRDSELSGFIDISEDDCSISIEDQYRNSIGFPPVYHYVLGCQDSSGMVHNFIPSAYEPKGIEEDEQETRLLITLYFENLEFSDYYKGITIDAVIFLEDIPNNNYIAFYGETAELVPKESHGDIEWIDLDEEESTNN